MSMVRGALQVGAREKSLLLDVLYAPAASARADAGCQQCERELLREAEMKPKLILATQDSEPTPEWREKLRREAQERWEWYQDLMAGRPTREPSCWRREREIYK
jgi:hypothetical protein